MAEDLDIEDLLEAPFKKEERVCVVQEARQLPLAQLSLLACYLGRPGLEVASLSVRPMTLHCTLSGWAEQEEDSSPRDDGSRRKHRRRHSHRRSRSRSRSPRRRRSHSRERFGHHRPRGSRRGGHERSRGSRSRERSRRSRSRERFRKSRSRSPERSRRSRSSSFDRHRRGSYDHRGRGNYWQHEQRSLSPARPVALGPPARRPSPNADPPSEDRDRRTVMCMQLSAKVSPKDLEEFFQKVGQVCDVKMISDRNSRRSKGIAYVEFYDEKSVTPALSLTGQKMFGVPIIVQPTMAEKNRLAAQAQNLKKAEGPKKLYVGSLHYNINEAMLKAIFEPFGAVEKIQIMKDETGLSKGYGFVEMKDSECAERAMTNLNGVDLAGRPMKVNNVTERDTAAMESLDGEDTDIGVGMTPAARAQLMAKLSDGHNAGLAVPQMGGLPATVPTASSCFMLANMFDATSENEAGWESDIRDDVLEECSKFGSVFHIHVDKFSQGNVFVKCSSPQVASSAFNNLNGRFFAGKKIVAQYIPEAAYHTKFPVAAAALVPLQPTS